MKNLKRIEEYNSKINKQYKQQFNFELLFLNIIAISPIILTPIFVLGFPYLYGIGETYFLFCKIVIVLSPLSTYLIFKIHEQKIKTIASKVLDPKYKEVEWIVMVKLRNKLLVKIILTYILPLLIAVVTW